MQALYKNSIIIIFIIVYSTSYSYIYKTYDSKASLVFPLKPLQFKEIRRTIVGNININIVRSNRGNKKFILVYQDLPTMAVMWGKGLVYTNGRDAFMKSHKAKIVYQKKINYRVYKGIEIFFKNNSGKGIVRFFLVKKRLYVIEVMGIKSPKEEDVVEFFSSFKINRS